MSETVQRARMINRTWITRGEIADNAEAYLVHLAKSRPSVLEKVCDRAYSAARAASAKQVDPKPEFYAGLFSEATPEERSTFLKDHPYTRRMLENSELPSRAEKAED